MLTSEVIVACTAILFCASLFRCVFGFGDSLIAMPLLVFLIPLQDAVVVGACFSLMLGLALTRKNFATIVENKREALRLIWASVVGIIFGVLLLKLPNTNFLLLVFAAYLIMSPLLGRVLKSKLNFADDRYAPIAGFVGGFFGGLFNTNGPPVLIYGNLRNWTPLQFGSILQPFFVLGNIIGLATYLLLGVMNFMQLKLIMIAMPFCVVAVFLGQRLIRFVNHKKFGTLTNGIIMLTGFMIMAKAISA